MYQHKTVPPKPTQQEVQKLITYLAAVADTARDDANQAISGSASSKVISHHTQRHDTALRHLATAKAMAARMH